MHRHKLPLILALVALALVISAVAVFARASDPRPVTAPSGPPIGSPHYRLNWNVAATGAGTVSSTHFRVSATAGQPATGFSGSSHFEVCSGFWCKVLAIFDLHLPVISRNRSP